MSGRRKYEVRMTINERLITQVVIDPHYESRYGDSMNDDIILDLVSLLDGKIFDPEKVVGRFQYFKADPLSMKGVNYRLIWMLEDDKLYVGVVNAFRR